MASNPEVIPKELRYGSVPTMPQSRSYLFKQRSEYVEYPAVSQGSTIEINIPRLQRTYLTKDSYLKLNIGVNFLYKKTTVSSSASYPIVTSFAFGEGEDELTLYALPKENVTGWKVTVDGTNTSFAPDTVVTYVDYENNQFGISPGLVADLPADTKLFFTSPDDTNIYLDRAGIYGLIDRIEIYDYMGSTLLERTSGVSDLMSLLFDTHSSGLEMANHYQISAGTGSLISESAAVSVVNATADMRKGSEIMNSPFGDIIGSISSSDLPGTSTHGKYYCTRQFAIPLPSFLGLFSDKYVPLHNGFTVKLILNDPTYAFVVNSLSYPITLTSVNVANVEFCAQVLELGPQAEGLIMDSLGGQPIALHTKSFRLFKDVINGSSSTSPQSTFRLDMDLNVISLTNLLWSMKPLEYKTYSASSTTAATVLLKTAVSASSVNPVKTIELATLPTNVLKGYFVSSDKTYTTTTTPAYTLNAIPDGTTVTKAPYTSGGKYYVEISRPVQVSMATTNNLIFYANDTVTRTTIPAANLYYQNIGQRIRNFLMRWNFQYGSSYLPNVNGINSMTNLKPSIDDGYSGPTRDYMGNNDLDVYMELIKARHRLNSEQLHTLISYGEYFMDTYNTSINSSIPYQDEVNVQMSCPKFACGLDLELVSGKSRDVICGINTNGLNTCINGWFNTDYTSTTSILSVVDALLLCWAEYDAFVNILPGVASTVAF